MTEKNILAYFNTPEQAQSVAAKLQGLKVEHMSIDRFSRYAGEGSNDPILTSTMSSLASVTQDGTFTKDAGVLAAADVTASGMSDGGGGGPTGKDILLTVVVDESSHHEALAIIEQSGGFI
ncbi:hypothetical protein J45TS6_05170 [Paenibacillus sp. J45TS6]|uniref:Heat induced stress protein YflT n=1 Tax=Paenibacillus polygoni TaxID=3050112 RepID=A0ABY8X1G1_9BACL|nr:MULTISPECIES: hypothetical protein [Paenibacillus]WIV18316.1 hypothetical protein QPK24_18220 [Paenibacillus polygoni]GIP42058.1 hypothetical protein J45TS6_05170 [Paenibacillus sp. J45TS6]